MSGVRVQICATLWFFNFSEYARVYVSQSFELSSVATIWADGRMLMTIRGSEAILAPNRWSCYPSKLALRLVWSSMNRRYVMVCALHGVAYQKEVCILVVWSERGDDALEISEPGSASISSNPVFSHILPSKV